MRTLALVTGASRGLGRNTALAIARGGGDVVVTYRGSADEAQAVVADIEALGRRAVALQLDTGEVDAFPAFVTRLRSTLRDTWQRETFDHLVNNAGHGDTAPIAETTVAQFDRLVDVHFKGVFFLTQALLPVIRDGGRIVNISTGLTRFAYPGYAAYAAATRPRWKRWACTWPRNWVRAVSRSTPWRRARSKPTSAAARSATTRRSTHSSPA